MVGQILMYVTVLLAACMTCHGELAQRRPDPRYLTRFYLVIAAGGALGGMLVALGAPVLLEDYWEYHLGLFATVALVLGCLTGGWNGVRRPGSRRGPAIAALGFLLLLGGGLGMLVFGGRDGVIEHSRNFFGVIRVHDEPGGAVRVMSHGRIVHGQQFLDEANRRRPTAYYGRASGVGIALERSRALRERAGLPAGLKVGVVGLGAGSMAALAEPGDHMRFYEINPEVERLAREHFTFLDDCAGTAEVILGDARIVLEREAELSGPHRFDVLAVDAFNGDAIPMHLLTREAFEIYWRQLRADGLLVLHISNRYVDLEPVVRGLAQDAGHEVVHLVTHRNRPATRENASDWMVVTSNRRFIQDHAVRVAASPPIDDAPEPIVWTDDFASLWSVLTPARRVDKWADAPNSGLFVTDHGDLLNPEDQQALLDRCRGIHHDSNGTAALIVLTVASLAETEAPSVGDLADAIFARLRDRNPESRLALMLVARDDRRLALRVDPRFEAEESLQASLLDAARTGLRAADRSAGFLAGLDPLADFVSTPQAARVTTVDDADPRP